MAIKINININLIIIIAAAPEEMGNIDLLFNIL